MIMTKKFFSLLVFSTMLLTIGCSKKAPENTNEETTPTEITENENPSTSDTVVNDGEDNDDISNDGEIVVDGITVGYNSDVDQLIESLGKPNYEDTSSSVENYNYKNGLNISAYNDGSSKQIFEIHVLYNETISTTRGIKKGDSLQDVLSTYGEDAEEYQDDNVHSLKYQFDGYSLSFVLDGNNNVESFFITNTTTDSKLTKS